MRLPTCGAEWWGCAVAAAGVPAAGGPTGRDGGGRGGGAGGACSDRDAGVAAHALRHSLARSRDPATPRADRVPDVLSYRCGCRTAHHAACPIGRSTPGTMVTHGQPGTPADLRTSRLNRCANRPSDWQRVTAQVHDAPMREGHRHSPGARARRQGGWAGHSAVFPRV